jgi:hypothetical protein
MTKRFIWIGLFVGSTLGNMLPVLWGSDAISVSGFFFSMPGGIVGAWMGYHWSRLL